MPSGYADTLKGMEDLVKQAFAFDPSACQYVYRGQYDLVGPDGAVILPILWATTIQPGWTVTMQFSHFDIHTLNKSPSPRQRVPSFRDPWTGVDIDRGRSLTRRRSPSPIVIDVVEGPTGVEIVKPGKEARLYHPLSTRVKSEPILQSRRTAISVPRQVRNKEGSEEIPPLPILIDVSPRPRTRGKDRRGLSRTQRSMSPVPPPPPPPPPLPAAMKMDEDMTEVRVLSPDSYYSDAHTESYCSSDTGGSILDPLQACKVPSTAEEALKRWTNIFG